MSRDLGKMKITVLVHGQPKDIVISPDTTVIELIKELLPSNDPKEYQLSLDDKSLELNLSLKENGVIDGSVLALTKNDGGGGSYQIL